MKNFTTTCATMALLATVSTAHAVDIAIVEDSGVFNAPGIVQGTVAQFSTDDPGDVTILGQVSELLNYGGLDTRPGDNALIGFENTTNSVRVLDPTGKTNTLLDSLGHIDTGVAGVTFSNDGSIVYAAGVDGAFGIIVEADALTGAFIARHRFVGLSISSIATVPDSGAGSLEPGELVVLVNTGGAAQLRLVDLDTDTSAVIGTVSGLGFTQAFETGLDFAPDGTLYAMLQGVSGGLDVSSRLYTLDPDTAAATFIGIIGLDNQWDASGIAVLPDEAPACPADFDGSGAVSGPDLLTLLNEWGPCDPCTADLTDDNLVNGADLLMLLNDWGPCPR